MEKPNDKILQKNKRSTEYLLVVIYIIKHVDNIMPIAAGLFLNITTGPTKNHIRALVGRSTQASEDRERAINRFLERKKGQKQP